MKLLPYLPLLILVSLVGCQGLTQPQVAEQPPSVVHHGSLYFATVDDFERFLNSTPQAQEAFFEARQRSGFTPYAYAFATSAHSTARRKALLIDDDFFGQLVNPDGVIHIGAWYLRINKPEERVYALHQDHYGHSYLQLIAQDLTNPHVLAFSTEDEVLYALEALDNRSTNARQAGLFCDNANGNKDTDNRWVEDTGINQHDTFLRYHYYGFGYSLKAQAKWRVRTGNNHLNEWDQVNVFDIVGTYNRSYTVKCGKHPGVEWLNSTITTSVVNEDNKWTFPIYRSTRKLSAYKAEMTITWTAPNGDRVSSKKMNISSGS